jgi:putative transposase
MSERKLLRLPGFNYSASRYYFFTICVKGHAHSFGSIEKKSMHLSHSGIIAFEQWVWLGAQYPYIDLISFIIMPDHVHGIIYIKSGHPYLKIKPLPELIGAYKTTVSKRIHQAGNVEFKWQKSYHDHIIRNIRSLNRIKHYIETNPENWMM